MMYKVDTYFNFLNNGNDLKDATVKPHFQKKLCLARPRQMICNNISEIVKRCECLFYITVLPDFV